MEVEVFVIGKVLDEELRVIKVYVEMVSDKFIVLLGMYVEVRIILEDQFVFFLFEEVIIVDKGFWYIFVKDYVDGDYVVFWKV